MGVDLDELMARIKAREAELRLRGVRHLDVFGSMARGQARPDSDVDIAVDIEADRPFSLFRLEDTRLLLQDAVGRKVDLGEAADLRAPVREAYERDRVRVF